LRPIFGLNPTSDVDGPFDGPDNISLSPYGGVILAESLLDRIGVHDRVVLIGHDWGGVLAVDWARRHPGAVRGIAYLETLVAPVSWTSANAPDPALFGPLRSSDGERLVLDENLFVEKVLPAGVVEHPPATSARRRARGSPSGR